MVCDNSVSGGGFPTDASSGDRAETIVNLIIPTAARSLHIKFPHDFNFHEVIREQPFRGGGVGPQKRGDARGNCRRSHRN